MKVTLAPGLEMAIDRAPHMLVAGATGMGKSAFLNALICDMATRYRHTELRMLMIDPKRVELSAFSDLPHLLAWPATEVAHAADTLDWLIREMDDRYRHMKAIGARSIDSIGAWPRIVCVVDEMAILLLDKRHGRTIEGYLVRLATLGRAAGIHLILATQTPRADVITGLIRANIPTRIAFGVVTRTESMIILDQPGAENLRTPGMFAARLPGSLDPVIAQSTYLDDDVIKAIINVACKKEPIA